MSYDAARINQLLAQLQNSSAFQSAVTPSPLQTPATSTNNAAQVDSSTQSLVSTQLVPTPTPTGTGSTVFDLLSRLNPGAAPTNPPAAPRPPNATSTIQREPNTSQSGAGSSSGLDMRYLTFQQALPYISRLTQRAEFRDKIKRMQDMQNQLEQSLYSDQQEVMKKHQQRVEYAQNRANIIGVQIGDQENEELASQLAADLKKFHASRVLVAWDAQRSKQQSQMESLGVPCMFVTSEPAALQRQQKVLRTLLESINESEDMA